MTQKILATLKPYWFKYWPQLSLLGIWVLAILIVWPVGEFSINDDWGWSVSVYWWRENGALEFSHWFAMTLITQLSLAMVWTEIFGLSQTSLRFLVLLLAGLSLLAVFGFARECGNDRRLSFLIAVSLIGFAPFVGVSFTFMTEAPFLLCLPLVRFISLPASSKKAKSHGRWTMR